MPLAPTLAATLCRRSSESGKRFSKTATTRSPLNPSSRSGSDIEIGKVLLQDNQLSAYWNEMPPPGSFSNRPANRLFKRTRSGVFIGFRGIRNLSLCPGRLWNAGQCAIPSPAQKGPSGLSLAWRSRCPIPVVRRFPAEYPLSHQGHPGSILDAYARGGSDYRSVLDRVPDHSCFDYVP